MHARVVIQVTHIMIISLLMYFEIKQTRSKPKKEGVCVEAFKDIVTLWVGWVRIGVIGYC